MGEKRIDLVREINKIEYACNAMLAKEYESLLDENITNSQMIMLGHIHQHGRLLTGELSRIMNITPSAVSQMLNKLEGRTYVKRSINPVNRREIFVQLDSAGVKHIENNEEIERSIIDRYYSKLDMADLASLKDIMLRFKGIIEQEQEQEG